MFLLGLLIHEHFHHSHSGIFFFRIYFNINFNNFTINNLYNNTDQKKIITQNIYSRFQINNNKKKTTRNNIILTLQRETHGTTANDKKKIEKQKHNGSFTAAFSV